jgi:AcrR family transcriptional regulator
MSTKTRKQREKEEREKLFIDLARKMIIRDGYLGLSMDRLAEEAEYSKGTIYQHFTTKEDLILAVTTESIKERSRLFTQASAFEGRTREQFMAIGVADEIFAKLYSELFQMEYLIKTNSFWEKTAEHTRQCFVEQYKTCFDHALGIIQSAFKAGDIANSNVTPQQVLLGVRTMSIGGHMLVSSDKHEVAWYGDDIFALKWENGQYFLDGIRWHPLSMDWDYQKTRERIISEVFQNEYKQLNMAK